MESPLDSSNAATKKKIATTTKKDIGQTSFSLCLPEIPTYK